MRNIFISVLLLFSVITEGYTQFLYPTFYLQNSAIPLYYNPGFAGTAAGPRISVAGNHYSQYFTNSYVSYDQYVKKIRSGVGVIVQYNNINIPEFMNTKAFRAGICLAPKITLNDSITFSPSISVFYKSIVDEISLFDLVGISNQRVKNSGIDGSVGLLINSRKFFAGITMGDFLNGNKDTTNVLFGTSRYTITSQAGINIRLNKNISFQPSSLFQVGYAKATKSGNDNTSSNWQIMNVHLNLNMRYKWLIVGTGANMYYKFGALGFQNRKFKAIASVGIPLASNGFPGVITDLSLSYVFRK